MPQRDRIFVGVVSLVICFGFLERNIWAAPCCSAGSALPALMTNDDLAQISVATAYSDTVMDAPAAGIPVLRSNRNADRTLLTRITGAYRFTEFWQIGAGTSLIQKTAQASKREFQESGLGDSDVSLGYELFPEWTYSYWRPHGWLYLQTVLPSGQAVQDPALRNPAQVRGQGVFQAVIGLVLTKSWNSWDIFLIPEIRRLYGRTFDGGNTLSGAWGGALQLGTGYSWLDWRMGLRTQPVFQGERSVASSGQNTVTPTKTVWNTGLDVSYLIGTTWLAALSYSDQTVFGPARNTTLERGVSLMIQRKWKP